MNIRLQRIKTIIFFLGIPMVSLLLVVWGNSAVHRIVDESVVEILAILVGLIIGAVGILIASLGSLFNNLLSQLSIKGSEHRNGISLEQGDNINFVEGVENSSQMVKLIEEWLNSCHNTVKEAKNDVMFLVLALLGCFVLSLLKEVNIPYLSWPHELIWGFTKTEVLSFLSICLLGYSFLAIVDVVSAIFTIYEHHEVVLKGHISANTNEYQDNSLDA